MEALFAVTKVAKRNGISADVRKALRRFCLIYLVDYCSRHAECSAEMVGRNKCLLCINMLRICKKSKGKKTSPHLLWTKVVIQTENFDIHL